MYWRSTLLQEPLPLLLYYVLDTESDTLPPSECCTFSILQVDAFVLDLFEKAREGKISVTRAVIQSFGRSARATLLDASATSADLKEKLWAFKAGETWMKNFVKRNGLNSKVRHGEAGSVNHERIAENMKAISCAGTTGRKTSSTSTRQASSARLCPSARTFHARRIGRRRGGRRTCTPRIACLRSCVPMQTALPRWTWRSSARRKTRAASRSHLALSSTSRRPMHGQTLSRSASGGRRSLRIRRWTTLPVLLLMDGCSSHEDLEDSKGQVKVVTYPPNCTSVRQPMDMGIIAATKLNYRRELLDMKVSTMGVAATLRAQAKQRNMAAGTAGLGEGGWVRVIPFMSETPRSS